MRCTPRIDRFRNIRAHRVELSTSIQTPWCSICSLTPLFRRHVTAGFRTSGTISTNFFVAFCEVFLSATIAIQEFKMSKYGRQATRYESSFDSISNSQVLRDCAVAPGVWDSTVKRYMELLKLPYLDVLKEVYGKGIKVAPEPAKEWFWWKTELLAWEELGK